MGIEPQNKLSSFTPTNVRSTFEFDPLSLQLVILLRKDLGSKLYRSSIGPIIYQYESVGFPRP